MSAIRTMIESLGLYQLLAPASRNAGTYTSASKDTRASGMGMHEYGLVLLETGVINGGVTVTIQHSHDNTTWATLATCNAVTGSNAINYRQVRGLRRYVRIQAVVTGNANLFSITLVGARNRREPIVQAAEVAAM